MTMPVFTGCLVEVRPVGIFHLVDRQASDEKIIAVPTNDPFASEIRDIGDLRAHSLREIEHFFEVYKDLEGVRVRSRGFDGRQGAEKAVLAAMASYERAFARRKGGGVERRKGAAPGASRAATRSPEAGRKSRTTTRKKGPR
jgi:inorganic pyrophosphatase